MNAERLLELYDRISEAPDAVARLRRFVLDLAVRGKLVEQDSADEPASELYRRIEAEQERRVRSGEFREPRNALRIDRDALPFAVPTHWVWCRLIDVARPSYGFAFKSSQFNSGKRGMPLIRIRDISKSDTEAYYDGEYDAAYIVRSGDYLVGMDGDFNLRRWQGKDALLNQRVMRINDWRCGVDPEFVRLPLQMVLDHLHGDTSLTTVKHLSAKQVNGIEVPLPPLEEQHRIVEKVDELMALCDRLEEARATREATRDRLTTASLARLTAADTDGQTFRSHARFALDAFPALTTRPDQIKALRQTILNLAVRGKLVEQDPADEQPPINSVSPEEIPFEVPINWRWVYFADVATFENGDRSKNYPKRSEYVRDGVPWINTGHITADGFLSRPDMNYITEEKFESLRGGKIRPGDLLYCLRGATFGKTAFVEPFQRGAIASSLIIIRPGEYLDSRYLFLFLMSPFGRQQLRRFDNGTAQPNLSAASVRKYLVPLPSLSEQKRIVVKCGQANRLCRSLEKHLDSADGVRRRLLEILLNNALEPAGPASAVA